MPLGGKGTLVRHRFFHPFQIHNLDNYGNYG
jgi:hypothetical protein